MRLLFFLKIFPDMFMNWLTSFSMEYRYRLDRIHEIQSGKRETSLLCFSNQINSPELERGGGGGSTSK